MPIIFNGAITITSPKGGHRTFQVKTKKADAKFAAGKRVLSLLNGPDNTSSYVGFAFVEEDKVRVWAKKQAQGPWVAYGKMVLSLCRDGEASPFHAKGYRVMVEKRCMKCNRKLTHPESIESGLGPECAGRGK
jgi:hypothetical protein